MSRVLLQAHLHLGLSFEIASSATSVAPIHLHDVEHEMVR